MRFNLFHRFATSELTHSGIWAWILQSLDDTCPEEYRELRPAARALLDAMGVRVLESPISVGRERKLPAKGGRVDIEIIDGARRVVVVETKVKARPDIAQRERYQAAYRAAEHDLVGITILSTTFDEPWNDPGVGHLGASDLLAILHTGSYRLDIMRQYVAWLEHEIGTRQIILERALGEDARTSSEALETAAAQWGVMRQLGEAIGGPSAARLYAGVNQGGTPWTQLAFSPGGPPSFDALFYRMDAWPGVAAQFTLRQYQKPIIAGKAQRLDLLRRLFREAAEEAGAPLGLFDTAPKGAKLRAQEAKVAQATIRNSVTARTILEHLPPAHAAFARRLADLGWPLRPAGPATEPDNEGDAS